MPIPPRALHLLFFIGLTLATLPTHGSAEVVIFDLAETLPTPNAVRVSTSWLPVQVERIDGSQVIIQARITADETGSTERVLLDDDDGTLVIQQMKRSCEHPNAGELKGYIRVGLPAALPLTIDTASGAIAVEGAFSDMPVSLSVASGAITVGEGVEASRLVINSASGVATVNGWATQVTFNSASGDLIAHWTRPVTRLQADSASGDIIAPGGAHWARINTASGDVSLSQLVGSVWVASISGDALLSWATLPNDAHIKVSTVAGSQTLLIPPGATPGGGVETLSGEVNSVLPIILAGANGGVFLVRGAHEQLDLHSVAGDIHIAHSQ